ncbi:MAG: response regulator transcription factor [Clostridia bacterium]|nr:response regulator transcription factor [Clostridia bacterium]
MYRTAIVEDTPEEVNLLRDYLVRYGSERSIAFAVSVFSSGEAFLSSVEDKFELILMDIEMPGLDGMETARKLREVDENACLLFVTRLANYAIQGYGVKALDFLVKPVTYENFCLKMDRAVTTIERNRKQEIIISTQEGSRRLCIQNILYVEIMNHTLVYHTTEGDFSVRGSIRDCEARLAAYDFARCNNSFLVNLRYVTEIRHNDIRVGNKMLPIGSTKRRAFLQQLTEFMGDVVL